MAASDYDHSVTRNQIIERAFRILGVLALGEPLSADQYTQATQVLNGLLKTWQSDRIFLWTMNVFTQALSVGDETYPITSFDPTILWIDRMWLRDSNNQDLEVQQISWRDYQDITDKADTGDPTHFALDTSLSTPTVYLYPKPSQAYTLRILAVCRLKDMETASGTPDMPQRFVDALTYGLAYYLGDEYGTPMGEMQKIEKKYFQLYATAKKSDRERADFVVVKGAF